MPEKLSRESGIPDEIWRILQADAAGANVLTVQPILPGASAINLLAGRTYELEVQANITRTAGAGSHTTSLSFAGTATHTAINVLASVGNPSGNILAGASEIMMRAITAVVATAVNTSTTEELRIWLRGMIITNAAGTFIPSFNYNTTIPGQAPTVRRGSFIRLKDLGLAAMTAVN